jgi:hypothetical protein
MPPPGCAADPQALALALPPFVSGAFPEGAWVPTALAASEAFPVVVWSVAHYPLPLAPLLPHRRRQNLRGDTRDPDVEGEELHAGAPSHPHCLPSQEVTRDVEEPAASLSS